MSVDLLDSKFGEQEMTQNTQQLSFNKTSFSEMDHQQDEITKHLVTNQLCAFFDKNTNEHLNHTHTIIN